MIEQPTHAMLVQTDKGLYMLGRCSSQECAENTITFAAGGVVVGVVHVYPEPIPGVQFWQAKQLGNAPRTAAELASTPSDGPRPVAQIVGTPLGLGLSIPNDGDHIQLNEGERMDLVTAADYDKLREQVERLREVAAVRLRSQEAAVERCAAAIAKVEAGEARIAKALEIESRQHWKFADEDPRDFGRVEGWNSALAEVLTALNEGNGE